MLKPAFFVLAFLVGCHCFAAADCLDANGNVGEQSQCAREPAAGANQLPEHALDQVNELKAKMRYFTAIGFHKQSKEQRDAIAAIYEEHGVPLPEEYKD